MEAFRAKINGMVVYTCFNNKSYFGYKSNALKSGICKYYRRNEYKKFLWCVIEMLLFRFHEKGGGLVTNLLNRLKILIMEDMSCMEVDRAILAIKKLDEFEKSERMDYNKIYEFCNIVIEGKKGRSISYLNCWWRNNPDKLDMSLISIKKVLKYAKKGDNEEILKLGEKLIEYLEKDDEKILDILMKMIKFEKVGKRYRRSDGVYLFMEILRDYCDNGKLIKLWDFAMEMLARKSMKERFYFAVWIGTIMWQKKNIDFSKSINDFDKKMKISQVLEHFCKREKIILDDYVLEDWHVNKKFTLEKFSKVGAFVENEDLTVLGESKFDLYKQFYIDKKAETIKQKPVTKKKVKKIENIKVAFQKQDKTREEIRNEKYKMIKRLRGKPNFNELENKLKVITFKTDNVITLCTETTCGNKVMCFEMDGKIWKESRKTMNYNRDYCVLDLCKEMFKLNKINMTRVLADFRIVKKDSKIKSWKDNWCVETIDETKEKIVYCVMDKIEPGIEVGKIKKEMLGNRKLLKEFVKIGVFRGIFRVSDFNGRNVLLKNKDELVSIDEGDIGKRLEILGAREKWLVNALNKDKTIINDIICELNECWGENKDDIIKLMKQFKFSDELVNEIVKNNDNLKTDLKKEGIEF